MLSEGIVAAEDVFRGCRLFGVDLFVILLNIGFKLVLCLASKIG